MAFTSIFKPFSTRPLTQDAKERGSFPIIQVFHNNFSISSWILIGASLQAGAVYLFSNRKYILLTSTIILLARLGRSLLQVYNVLPNPHLQGVIPGRTTALMPNEDGEIDAASSRKIAILHLGAKSNHPFGFFAPQFITLGDWLGKMNKEMDAGNVKGFLGQTTFNRRDQTGAPEVVLLSYWESIEDLWAFAHTGLHREAWQWWEKTIKDNGYVGINHEIFEADPKHWENIYVNFQPTLMGATTYVRNGKGMQAGTVAEEWISPLVDARRGKLAKSSGRMGREISIYDATRVAKETYE